MKKIGIATFHYADNFGAVLQAYALRKAINMFPGCEAELINYVPKGHCYPVWNEIDFISKKEKRKKFETFLYEKCGLCYPMINAIEGKDYDVYIAGSDQIWNMDIPEADQDKEYLFPHLDPNTVRVAYAASIGMEKDRMDEALFMRYLPRFSRISLREKSYVEIISQLSGKKCGTVIDPTLLLDRSDYEELLEKPNSPSDEYLLFFMYGLDDYKMNMIEMVNCVARNYGLKVYHTIKSDYSVCKRLLFNAGDCVIDAGVEEFLWYIENAQIIITDSYHCMLFSLIFDKPVYVLPPNARQSRQIDFMDTFGLNNLMINDFDNWEMCKVEHDYSNFRYLWGLEKDKSLKFLKDAIGD